MAELEALLDEFNIFEAISAVRQVRHSDFLAFLLSPQERHGQALKEFLIDPWIAQKTLNRQRCDLRIIINYLFSAKSQASVSLMLFEQDYTEKSDSDDTHSVETIDGLSGL